MLREGVTSTLYFRVKPEVLVDVEVFSLVIMQQNKILVEKSLEDCALIGSDVIAFSLTEDEALSLKGEGRVRAQARVKYTNGRTDASNTVEASVESILKKGAL